MKQTALRLTFAGLAALTLTACDSANPVRDRVSIADSETREHLEADLNLGDLMGFAENITNKMLADPKLADWAKRRPRLIVGRIRNNTDDPNLRVEDMYDRIQETLFNAGVARIVDNSATRFDYIVRSEITSSRQYGEKGEELVEYKMTLKLFNLKGDLQGHWSDRLKLAKARRGVL
ncbi:hypothetical protein [Endothiovibrio diazotrophicus]